VEVINSEIEILQNLECCEAAACCYVILYTLYQETVAMHAGKSPLQTLHYHFFRNKQGIRHFYLVFFSILCFFTRFIAFTLPVSP
jgi:hypothetical protein